MSVISVEHLTKDYGHQRGVFDVSLQVEKGECYGFLGPNGAGKTTTIRHMMGFSKPDSGISSILEKDSWSNSAMLMNSIGYLPGEVALPSRLSGTGFLRMMGNMRNVTNEDFVKSLLKRFDLDPNIKIKQMSLGVKRKLAVVTAFMHDPDILILDEPTSGLDPVMQEVFIEFVLDQKARGKTIFLSSHIFHEVDACCDRIAIIRHGSIASEFQSESLKQEMDQIFRITFEDESSYQAFLKEPYHVTLQTPQKYRVRIQVPRDQTTGMVSTLSRLKVADFVEIPFTLEDYFMSFYQEEEVQ